MRTSELQRGISCAPLLALALVGGCYRGADAGAADGSGGSGEAGEAGSEDGSDGGVDPAGTCEDVDPGRVTLHRLNRSEYDNTIRDLLGLALGLSAAFPDDTHVEGFDNNAEALTISPLLVEKYMAAAEAAVDAALADPTARGRLMICTPADADPRGCAAEILGTFMPRAFRRPVGDDEIAGFVDVAMVPIGQGETFEAGMAVALRGVLVSPHFLYRPEPAPGGTDPGAIHALDPYALASRLSYFVWSSMPDDELFELAANGGLLEKAEIDRQVRRMLADPKADAFIRNFAGQWLHARAMPEVRPDAELFPSFDEELRVAMEEEAYAFFGEVLRGGWPTKTLLTADFALLDARLAAHYEIPWSGNDPGAFAFVELGDAPRGGILRQASFLSVTSHPNRTSAVKRGKWVVQQLLCVTPPVPPPGVDQLPEDLDPDATQREIFEQHRADPACAGCHTLMDPLGFGLEHYDAIGAFREQDNGQPIDASGMLPAGAAFDGAGELATALADDPRFARCVTKNVFTYALGRAPTDADACTIDAIAQTIVDGEPDLADLLVSIAVSPAVTHRRAEED